MINVLVEVAKSIKTVVVNSSIYKGLRGVSSHANS